MKSLASAPFARNNSYNRQKFPLTGKASRIENVVVMKQRYHTIIKLDDFGTYMGWVEELPGALTHAKSLHECRRKLREALQLMIETHRDEARLALDRTCIQESIEIEVADGRASYYQSQA